jgi:PAS domain-containing protein
VGVRRSALKPGGRGALRVLLVASDMRSSSRIASGLAQARGATCEVMRARTLADALAFLPQLNPEVVLLELGDGGVGSIARVDRFLEVLPELPLVVLTSQSQEWLGVAAVQHGAQDFLVRETTEPEQLVRALRYAVERFQLLDQLATTLVEARAGEMRVRRLLERAIEGLVVLDEQQCVTLCNGAAARLLGLKRSELVGVRWDVVWNAIARPLEGGRRGTEVHFESDGVGPPGVLPTEVQECLVHVRGVPVPLGVRVTRLEWEGKPGSLVSLTDLSDRKRGERIALAEGVQRLFLPERQSLALGSFEVAASNDLCEDVSGDFYDAVPAPDGRLAVAVGDVSGHGLGAALLMAQGRASLRAHLAHVPAAAEVLRWLNGALGSDVQGHFLSLFLALVCPRTGALEWASAGHEAALLVRARSGRVERLRATGPPVWILPGAEYRAGRAFRLEPGDLLLVHSDGATEAPNPAGERFGSDRLVGTAASLAGSSPEALLCGVRTALRAWTGARPLHDDLTLLALRRVDARGEGPAEGCEPH